MPVPVWEAPKRDNGARGSPVAPGRSNPTRPLLLLLGSGHIHRVRLKHLHISGKQNKLKNISNSKVE